MKLILTSAFVGMEIGARLLEAIDETLENRLGQRCKTEVYECLEKKFMLKRSEIPIRPQVFSTCMDTLLGSTSMLIELEILRNFYSRLNFCPHDHIATLEP
jgi:hypothetical protein